MVLMKPPRLWQVFYWKCWYNVGPKSLFSLEILTRKIGHGFLASRNMVLIKQPRFWRVFNLKFPYNVGPKSLFSLKKKIPRFRQAIQTMCFWFKNLVLKKYPKISTGVNPGILIQCRPNVFALFKKPMILTSKSWPWVFGFKKRGSYEILQDFDTC